MRMTPEQHKLVLMLAEMGKKLNPEFNTNKFLSEVDDKLTPKTDKPTTH